MLIEIKDLRKTYQMGDTLVKALQGVSLTVDKGEFLAIMGPSGSGKSTLMHVLGLLDTPDAGSYKLLGSEISKLTENKLAELRRATIGFVFQQFNLLSRTTALENVALPLIYGHSANHAGDPKQLLEAVGLGTRMYHKPNELSGGQQQRVAIARSLVHNPKILFADEPTGNLDSKSQEEIMQIFKKLNDDGITIILVTHEEEIAEYAKRVIKMRDGVVVSDIRKEQKGALSGTSAGKESGKSGAAAVGNDALTGKKLSAGELIGEVAQHFKQAWRSLAANKVRTGLSMLGILIGVGSVIAMLALGTGAKESLEKQLASMGSNLLVLRPGSQRSGGVSMQSGEVTRFTVDDARQISAEISSIRRAAPSVSGRAQIVFGNKNWNTQIRGTTHEYAPMRASIPDIGRFVTQEDNATRARVAVIGRTIVRELFGGKNPIGEMVKINKINFQVVGILPEKGATSWQDQDDLVVVPLETAMKRLLGKDYVDNIDLEVVDAQSMESAQEQIKSLIIETHRLPPSQQDSFQIRNMAEIQSALTETSKTMTWLLGSIAFVSLMVGGIGIMNIMLVSVTERTREIGLRKAVGATQVDILSQFLIEAVVVSVAGGLCGVALGAAISMMLSSVAGWTTSVSLQSVLISVLFSLAVGVGFGLWPARKAAALHPIDALRYE